MAYLAILIAVAIVGALAAGSIQAGASLQRRAAEEELLFVGSQFQLAFKTYYETTPSGKRPYPSDLGELLRDHRFPGIRRHLRKAYYDPLTGKSEWGVAEAPEGGIMGVYSLATETPIKLTGFPEQFSQLEGKTKYTDWIFGYPPIDLSRHQLLPRTPQ